MNEELVARLKDHEDNFIERKTEGAGTSEFRKTIVAFANSVPEGRTAILYIGVEDRGRVTGVNNTDKLQKTIRSICDTDCYPPVRFTSEVVAVDGKNILAVIVGPTDKRPHFSGPAFVRKGSESVNASDEMFEELLTMRLSKPGQLLRLRGQAITVIAKQKELGSTQHISDSMYRARHECQIEECTSVYVRLYDIGQSRKLSEPLENVTISYDEERHRPMLIVQPRP